MFSTFNWSLLTKTIAFFSCDSWYPLSLLWIQAVIPQSVQNYKLFRIVFQVCRKWMCYAGIEGFFLFVCRLWEVCGSSCSSTEKNQTGRPYQAKSGALKECNLICCSVKRMFCQSATLLLGHVGPAVCVCLLLHLTECMTGAIHCLFGCKWCRVKHCVMHKCTLFPVHRESFQ